MSEQWKALEIHHDLVKCYTEPMECKHEISGFVHHINYDLLLLDYSGKEI